MDRQEPRAGAEHIDFGAMRTKMAANRTLMAWVRTSLSLLSFSFTIYKVLQEFQEAGRVLPREETPRNVGIFLAVAGTVAIVMGSIEYWWTLRQLHLLQRFSLVQPTLIIALLMCVLGLILCFGLMTRII